MKEENEMSEYEWERHYKNLAKQKEIVERLKDVSRALNQSYDEAVQEGVKEFLQSEHRTLQQNFMRSFILPALETWAEMSKEGWVDLRNEDTCNKAVKMLEALGEEKYLRHV